MLLIDRCLQIALLQNNKFNSNTKNSEFLALLFTHLDKTVPKEIAEQVNKKIFVMKSNTRKSKMISKDALFLRSVPYFLLLTKQKETYCRRGEEYLQSKT